MIFDEPKIPKVTVLMTVYNGEQDIHKSLTSVLHQSMEDYEVVVVDDGSADRTWYVLESYAVQYPRLRIIHSSHVGRARALNLGLAHARGEYVAINDADDISLGDRLLVQATYLDEHPEAVLVGGWAQVRGDDEQVLGERRIPTDDKRLRRRLALGNPFIHSTVMYRKRALRQIGGFSEAQRAGIDYDAIERLARIGKLACVPRVVGIHFRSERQYFRSRMNRAERWRAAADVAMRAALHNAWWLLPVAIAIYGATRLPLSEMLIERIYGRYSRLVRGGSV